MSAKLVLVRGLPGSGKSTLAKKIRDHFNDTRGFAPFHYEADKYWVRPDGFYDFNPRRLQDAHEWCREKVQAGVIHDALDPEPYAFTVVSNTFTTLKEMQPYLSMLKNVKDIRVIHCTQNYGSIHDIPVHTIHKMGQRWQDTPEYLREIKYDGKNFDEVLDFVLSD